MKNKRGQKAQGMNGEKELKRCHQREEIEGESG